MIAPELSPLESLRDAAWNLEDFVAEVNTRLPGMLPSDYGDARQREDFSVRLLRHYASLGLVDESERVGREARYRYRHLLQVLSLRRLQRQGWNSKAISDFVSRDNAELETFLSGQTSTLEPAAETQRTDELEERLSRASESGGAAVSAPEMAKKAAAPRREASAKEVALDFLASIRSRTAPAAPGSKVQAQTMPAPAPLPQFLLHDPPRTPEHWRRIEVAPGLELHISDRYRKARTNADKSRLREALEQALESDQSK